MTSSLGRSSILRRSRITTQPVAEPQHLLQLGGDEDHRHALAGELGDQLLDLGLGADVDAAGRLVEDEHLRLGDQPAGQQHLLLVAAARGCASARSGRPGGCRAPRCTALTSVARVACGIGRSQPREACSASSMLSATVRSSMTPSARRFSLENAILRSIACRGLRSRRRSARTSQLAGVGGVGAEQQPGELGAAGAEQAGDPDDLALVDARGRRPRRRALAAQAERLEHRGPGLVAPSVAATSRSMRSSASSSRPIISPHQLELGDVLGHALPDQRAVAQHRHPVGDLEDLVEEVRDEHDRDALLAQRPHHLEQLGRPRRRPGWRSARRGSAPGRRRRRRGRSRPAAGPRSGARPSSEAGSIVEAEPVEGLPGPAVHRRGRCRPNRRGSRPSSMFSATVRFVHRLTSWYTVLMPAAWEAAGRGERLRRRPATVMLPASML